MITEPEYERDESVCVHCGQPVIWLDIKENPPTKGKDYLFVVKSIVSLLNNRVLAGRYQGNDSFAVVGTSFRSIKYQELPKV